MVEIVSSVGLVALIAFALVKAYTNKILTIFEPDEAG
jgi:hypothetical protein